MPFLRSEIHKLVPRMRLRSFKPFMLLQIIQKANKRLVHQLLSLNNLSRLQMIEERTFRSGPDIFQSLVLQFRLAVVGFGEDCIAGAGLLAGFGVLGPEDCRGWELWRPVHGFLCYFYYYYGRVIQMGKGYGIGKCQLMLVQVGQSFGCAWRPAALLSAQDMQVQMRNFLASMFSVIDHNSEALVQLFQLGNLSNGHHQFPQDDLVPFLSIADPDESVLFLRDDEHVNGGLRVDVPESQDLLVLVDNGRGDFLSDDLIEDGLA